MQGNSGEMTSVMVVATSDRERLYRFCVILGWEFGEIRLCIH